MFEAEKWIRKRVGIGMVAVVVLLLGLVSAAWCLPADYDGTYYGTFSGDDSGIWVAVVSYTGDTVFLSYSNSSGEGDGGYMSFYGEVGTVGNYYTPSSVIQGSWVDGYIDSTDGSVSGSWGNSYSGDTGTISGSAYTTFDYAGSYSGSFSGDDSGTWSMTIASDGYVTGTISPASGGTYSFEGGCHPDGHVIVVGEDDESTDFAFYGQISGSTVSGGWVSEDGYSGTVGSGSSGGDGDGDGGGGCFIMSLAGE
jgi:hypothetical protein